MTTARGDSRARLAAELTDDPQQTTRALVAKLGCGHRTVAVVRAELEASRAIHHYRFPGAGAVVHDASCWCEGGAKVMKPGFKPSVRAAPVPPPVPPGCCPDCLAPAPSGLYWPFCSRTHWLKRDR